MELTDITSIFTQVSSLQGIALLAAALVVLGYVLKGLPFVPNQIIPALVILAGGILNPLLVPRSSVSPEVGNVILHLALQGVIAGFVAWVLHNKLLSKWIDPAVFKGSAMLLCIVALTGCALTQGIDWSKVVGAVANAGLTMVLRNNPQSAAYIGLTQTILDSFIARKTTDLSLLERDLQQVPAEWREVIKIALDEAGTKIGTKLTEDEKLALLHQYLEAIRNGVANVGKPAAVHSREYQEAQRILKERGFNLSQYPASKGFATTIPSPPAPAYGWRTLWVPGIVAWADCPVTPDKMPLGPVGEQMCVANLIGRY